MAEGELEIEGFDEPAGVEVLQKVPMFAKLNYEDTVRLASIARMEKFAPGTVIIQQDSLGDALYIIRAGEVVVTTHGPFGPEDVGRLRAGETFGEMSLIDEMLTSANVVAAGEVETMTIPRRQFESLVSSDDKLAVKIYKAFARSLSDRLRRVNLMLAAANIDGKGPGAR